ncbi:hypothetical protein ACWFZ6_07965 [Methylorubrum extorquens]
MSEQHQVGLDVSVKETAICIIDPGLLPVSRTPGLGVMMRLEGSGSV